MESREPRQSMKVLEMNLKLWSITLKLLNSNERSSAKRKQNFPTFLKPTCDTLSVFFFFLIYRNM
ncbi:Protein CBG20452 [Caenorhabditis briggsae]|uniref:Protein CBG20452 n=1 Tax=Caenorhabditis briggsae TaxID=6238 RepID=A8XXT6_CAEBR|nr:Protein CBG20452 [Caenorhabditis briggsae]CAP37455.2 Protein CBG20452 [Caenorhabditis briggsae]